MGQAVGETPVPALYERLGIRQLRLPVGYSQYQPVEYFFNWLDDDLRRKARPGARLGEWTFEDFEREIAESVGRVTREMVKGWYREAWRRMLPRAALPASLRRSHTDSG